VDSSLKSTLGSYKNLASGDREMGSDPIFLGCRKWSLTPFPDPQSSTYSLVLDFLNTVTYLEQPAPLLGQGGVSAPSRKCIRSFAAQTGWLVQLPNRSSR
jgi:hypothetical protein